jgi:precorrin-2 dehydrogenase/sirohydrochlorin ferrochelatase
VAHLGSFSCGAMTASRSPELDVPAGGQPGFAVMLLLGGRRCLVVGSGPQAISKVRQLHEAGAQVRLVAEKPVLEPLPDEVGYEIRPYQKGEVDGYFLVVAASDPQTNREIFLDAEEAGVFVNSPDQLDACSCIMPAVLRRGPVVVAVSTSAQSPALAVHLRNRFAQEIGPEWGELAELLGCLRRSLAEKGVSPSSVDWHKAFDANILSFLRAGRKQAAQEVLERCLSW